MFDSFCTTDGCMPSILALALGVVGVFLGNAFLAWLCNPLLLLSWIIIKRSPTASLIFGISALLVSLSFMFYDDIDNVETGEMEDIIEYKLGYWLWVLSSLPIIVGNLVQLKLKKLNQSSNEE